MFNDDGTDVVFVDPLRPLLTRLVQGGENANEGIDVLLDHLEPVIEGRAVVLVTHSGKDITREARGASSQLDQAGVVFSVKAAQSGLASLRCEYWRDGNPEDQPNLQVRLNPDGTVGTDLGPPTNNVSTDNTPVGGISGGHVLGHIRNNPGTTVSEMALALGMKRPTVHRHVKELDGQIVREKHGREVRLYPH